MNPYFKRLPAAALAMLISAPVVAQDNQGQAQSDAQAAVRETIEQARAEEQQAQASVERARADLARVQAESRARSAEQSRAAAEISEAERLQLDAMREELSRVHENLRRASREVARVHREIDRTHARRHAPFGGFVNVGDKAIIGVVLGDSGDDGVPVLGVSPDGPAERAGIKQGDVIVSMMEKPLVDNDDADARQVLSEVMEGVKVGDELLISVQRGDEVLDFKVTADKREPFAWQSIVRLPSAPSAPTAPVAPDAPGVTRIERHIRIPEVATAELQEKLDRIRSELGNIDITINADGHAPLSDGMEETWEYRFETLSDLGGDVLTETNVWFGLPATRGLKMAEVNEGLGEYFDVAQGVLILSAMDDNDLQLQSGDVVLQVGDRLVSKPSDVIRALRDWEPGASIELQIKRNRRNETLEVVLPERSFGFNFAPLADDHYFHVVAEEQDK
ncbi:MAG: PDZ domain-containing protein [Xanthomonadales bacterium]|nr:PDZ domain-containing protein [Gammaproteobacteria bacterium]NNE04462.1 PDZ domain-containing protein [Xanthomonadales bacterium]NNL94122.1 PDZ domain-containing protein [Xanthomonadales bacterium]